jgi:hypothetical protein
MVNSVEVFVRSHGKYIGINFYKEMFYHWQSIRTNGPWIVWLSSLKVVYFLRITWGVFEQVLEIARETSHEAKV